MASISSRPSESMAGVASSAARIVMTSAMLAAKKYKRRSRLSEAKLSPFADDDSVKNLVAIEEGEEMTDFDFKEEKPRHPRVKVVRSRSPSPVRRSASTPPMREITLQLSGKDVKVSSTDLADALQRVRSRRASQAAAAKESADNDDNASKQTEDSGESLSISGPDHIDFYLPQLGKDSKGKLIIDATLDDPTAICNILRPWQVDFLESLGIVTAAQFLKVKKRRNLAKDMKKWRKQNGFRNIKTRSCKVALHIWAYTCAAVIEDVKKQRAQGKTVEKPKFLQKELPRRLSSATLDTLDASCSSSDS